MWKWFIDKGLGCDGFCRLRVLNPVVEESVATTKNRTQKKNATCD